MRFASSNCSSASGNLPSANKSRPSSSLANASREIVLRNRKLVFRDSLVCDGLRFVSSVECDQHIRQVCRTFADGTVIDRHGTAMNLVGLAEQWLGLIESMQCPQHKCAFG